MTRALQSTYNLYTSHGFAVHQPPDFFFQHAAGVGERSCSTDWAHFAVKVVKYHTIS